MDEDQEQIRIINAKNGSLPTREMGVNRNFAYVTTPIYLTLHCYGSSLWYA